MRASHPLWRTHALSVLARSRNGAAALGGLGLWSRSRLDGAVALAHEELDLSARPLLRLEAEIGERLIVSDLLAIDLQEEVTDTQTSLVAQSALLPSTERATRANETTR